jgi:REP element-mobilizing transposase RayT
MAGASHSGQIPTMDGKPHSHRLRIGRHSESGGVYLLTACCRDRIPHFADPSAAGIVLDALRWLDRQGRIKLFAAVVMPDHVHFVGVLSHGPLARTMHALKGYSASRIHRECGKPGCIWQAGYHDRALRDDARVQDAVDYCLQNPVRAVWWKISATIRTPGVGGGDSRGCKPLPQKPSLQEAAPTGFAAARRPRSPRPPRAVRTGRR